MNRCGWCGTDPIYIQYHDTEWGVPVTDDTKLFEFLILEGAQAGLSWITILKRREGYRKAFVHFDIQKVASFSSKKIDQLCQDSSIIRNRLKIKSAVTNAQEFLKIQKEFGSFYQYLLTFTKETHKTNNYPTLKDIPATSKESDALSKDLKRRGFKFTGSTIMYAFMQATGFVNDHITSCYRHKEVLQKGSPSALLEE